MLVLKKGNNIEASSVRGELDSYNRADKLNKKYGFESSYVDFVEAGMVLITNAMKEYGEIRNGHFC